MYYIIYNPGRNLKKKLSVSYHQKKRSTKGLVKLVLDNVNMCAVYVIWPRII